MAPLDWLPPRRAFAGEASPTAVLTAAGHVSNTLALLLQKQRWGALCRLLYLVNLTVDCHADTAEQLAAAGAASLATGVLHQCPQAGPPDAPLPQLLRASALVLLLRLLRADERTVQHLLTREALSVILSTLQPGSNLQGPANAIQASARQSAAALVHSLACHSRSCKEALLTGGALHVLVNMLSDLPSLCDLGLVQEALCAVCSLRVEAASLGKQSWNRVALGSSESAGSAGPASPAGGISPSPSVGLSAAGPSVALSLAPSLCLSAVGGAMRPVTPSDIVAALAPLLHVYHRAVLPPLAAPWSAGAAPPPPPSPAAAGATQGGVGGSHGVLLALVVRAMHVVLASDDECKEALRGAGVVQALVRMLLAGAEEAAIRDRLERRQDAGSRRGSETGAGEEERDSAASGRLGRFSSSGLSSYPLPDRDYEEDDGGGVPAHKRGGARRSLKGSQQPSPRPPAGPWQRLNAALLLRPPAPPPALQHPQLAETAAQASPSSSRAQSLRRAGSGASSGSAAAAASWRPATLLPSYSLLLPLLPSDAQPSHLPVSPVKEAAALLRALLSDSPANQALSVEMGLIPALMQLVSTGDMELAWHAADIAGTLGHEYSAQLLAAGAAEALSELLQEAADALHLLTVQRQLHEARAVSSTGAGSSTAKSSSAAKGGGMAVTPSPVQLPQQQETSRPRREARVRLAPLHHPLAFTSGASSCTYAAGHGAASFCNLCVPSAALKALLRLLDPATSATAAGGAGNGSLRAGAGRNVSFNRAISFPALSSVSESHDGGCGGLVERFADAGGVYTLFLLLHHEEVSGVTHSKLASSVVSFLGHILAKRPGAQDEVRQVGGIAILSSLLQGLMRPGVTDIYQLRVSVCMAVKKLVEGNAANRLLAREHGLLPPLMDLLKLALGEPLSSAPSKLPSGSSAKGAKAAAAANAAALAVSLLEAEEQVAVAAMDTLMACVPGSSGNQDALVSLGIAKVLYDVLSSDDRSVAVYASALNLTAAMCEHANAVQAAVLGAGLLYFGVRIVERTQNWGDVAGGFCALLLALLRAAAPEARPRILASGALRVLVVTLNARPAGKATETASSVLQLLVAGDVDLQNEVAAQCGGLHCCMELISTWHGPVTHSMFRLLVSLAAGNTYVKNLARQSGFLPLLLAVMRGCTLTDPHTAILSAQALTTLVQSNHASQSALAEAGGIDALADLLHVAIISPEAVPASVAAFEAAEAAAAAASAALPLGGAGPAAAGGRFSNGGGGGWRVNSRVNPAFERHRMSSETGGGAGGGRVSYGGSSGMLSAEPSSMMSPTASGVLTGNVGMGMGGGFQVTMPAGASGGMGGSSAAVGGGAMAAAFAELGPLGRAAERAEVVEELLLLLGAVVEFNAGNKTLVRESGCLTVLLHFLRLATSLPEPGPMLSRGRLLPAVCAACCALSRLAQDSPENQRRLAEGGEGPGANESVRGVLLKLLDINDPVISLEAARTLEYMTLGCENTPELEEEAVRALVKVLHSRGTGAQAAGSGTAGSGAAGAAAAAPAGAVLMEAPAAAGGGKVSAAVVKEASGLLCHVIAACNSVLIESGVPPVELPTGAAGVLLLPGPPPGKGGKARGGPGAKAMPAASPAAKGRPGPGPVPPPALAMQPLPTSFNAGLPDDAGGRSSPRPEGAPHGSGAAAAAAPFPPNSGAEPSTSTSAGAASSSSSALPGQQQQQQWQQVVGRSAPAFQAVACSIPEGPWKPVMLQLAWVLFLLAVKSRPNLELLVRLLRTTLLPLIQQLENAEASHAVLLQALVQQQQQQAAGGAAGAAAGAGAAGWAGRQVLSSSASIGHQLPISTFANDSLMASVRGISPVQSGGGSSGGGSGGGGSFVGSQGGVTAMATSAAAPPRVGLGRSGSPREGIGRSGSPREALGGAGSGSPHRCAPAGSPFEQVTSYLSPLANRSRRQQEDGGPHSSNGGGGSGSPFAAAQPSGSPLSGRPTSDDDDLELIRQEVALMAGAAPR